MYRVTESWQLTRALSAVFFPTVDSTIRSAGTVVAAISLREVFSNFVLFTIVITDWKQIFSTWILFNFDLQKLYYVALFIFSQFRFVMIKMIKHILWDIFKWALLYETIWVLHVLCYYYFLRKYSQHVFSEHLTLPPLTQEQVLHRSPFGKVCPIEYFRPLKSHAKMKFQSYFHYAMDVLTVIKKSYPDFLRIPANHAQTCTQIHVRLSKIITELLLY